MAYSHRDIIRHYSDNLRTGLMQAIGPSAADDYAAASERAATILRNI